MAVIPAPERLDSKFKSSLDCMRSSKYLIGLSHLLNKPDDLSSVLRIDRRNGLPKAVL